jgi:hypothetical protein
MGEVFTFGLLALAVWGWPVLGAIIGYLVARRGRPAAGAAMGFVLGCLMTAAAYRIATGPNLN